MNDHITLGWVNTIRRMRAEGYKDKEIVDELFRFGLFEEKRIEQWYKIFAARESRKRNNHEQKALDKLFRDVEKIGL